MTFRNFFLPSSYGLLFLKGVDIAFPTGFVSSSQSAVQSITLPQVQEQGSSISQTQNLDQGSRTDMRFLFDLVDEQHGGKLAEC